MMRSRRLFTLSLLFGISTCLSTAFPQQKIAQTGFQFLSVGTDARATAMGEAVTTQEGSPMALFYNPAGMARVESFIEFSANHMQWLSGIDYFTSVLSVRPSHGEYGVLGVSFMFVDYGNIIGTVVAANEQGFVETGNISPNAYALGFGYSKALTDRFAVGGQIKYVKQSLGNLAFPTTDSTQSKLNFSADVFAFDFGTIYRTGFKSLSFGMTIRNFSRQINYINEDFELPLTFKIGFSIDAFDFVDGLENQSFLVTFDAVNPRSFQEFFSIGGEYKFMDTLSLRAGYVANQDDYDFTAGFGLNIYKMNFDYSFTPFNTFENVHRFSIKFKL